MTATVLDSFTAVSSGGSFTPSAGSDRLVLLVAGSEDGNHSPYSLTAVTLGAQAMTEVESQPAWDVGTGSNRLQVFKLDEAGIAAMSGAAFARTWSSTPDAGENFSFCTLQDVDQITPTGTPGDDRQTGSVTTVTLGTGIAMTSMNASFVAGLADLLATDITPSTGYTDLLAEQASGGHVIHASWKQLTEDSTETPTLTSDITLGRFALIVFEITAAPVLQTGGSTGYIYSPQTDSSATYSYTG